VTRDTIQVSLLPEPRESLAHRSATHAVLASEHDLRQGSARRISPLNDPSLDVVVRAIDLRSFGSCWKRRLGAHGVYGKYTNAFPGPQLVGFVLF
jgi:hypothetical protein